MSSPLGSRPGRAINIATTASVLAMGLVGVPGLYLSGVIGIETVNMLGRYLCFALLALSLDLIWGYGGMLCLCQSFFFSLGGYAMGMFLSHHGGPEGIMDANGWKLPAGLSIVYPLEVGQAPEEALVPWFWKPCLCRLTPPGSRWKKPWRVMFSEQRKPWALFPGNLIRFLRHGCRFRIRIYLFLFFVVISAVSPF